MKRILSIILALTMILSTVAFAAPAMVSTVETSAEVTDVPEATKAEVQEETVADANIYDDTYGLLVAKMDFESSGVVLDEKMKSGTNLSSIGYTAPNLPEGFPEGGICFTFSGTSLVPKKSADGTNTYGYFTKTAGTDGYCKIGFRGQDELPMPAGTYTFKANIKTLTKNGTEIASDTAIDTWTSDTYLAKAGGAYGGEWNYLSKMNTSTTDTISNGHWQLTHSYRFLEGEKYKLNGYKSEEETPNLNIDFNGVSAVLAMFNAGNTDGYTYEMDNFELYYKAPVTVSFNNGGVEGAQLVGADGAFKVHNGAALNTSAYSYKNTSSKLFTGWRDQNGNSVWGTVNPTEDLVLTAQWIDAYDDEYGMLSFSASPS